MGCCDLTVSWNMVPKVVRESSTLLPAAESFWNSVFDCSTRETAQRIFQYSSCKSTTIASECHMGPLICVAFIVHHMPTFRPQRGISWIKYVLAELQYQLFGKKQAFMTSEMCHGCNILLHLWVHSDPCWWLSQMNVKEWRMVFGTVFLPLMHVNEGKTNSNY
jgi:hypothetical protein